MTKSLMHKKRLSPGMTKLQGGIPKCRGVNCVQKGTMWQKNKGTMWSKGTKGPESSVFTTYSLSILATSSLFKKRDEVSKKGTKCPKKRDEVSRDEVSRDEGSNTLNKVQLITFLRAIPRTKNVP